MKTIILEQPETETILAKDADVSKGIVVYENPGSHYIGSVICDTYLCLDFRIRYHTDKCSIGFTSLDALMANFDTFTFKQLS